MSELSGFALLCFTSFFTLINPLGAMPIFITLTATLTPEQRLRTARKASIVSLLTLLVFAFSGQLLFRFFNISVDSFRIVGGVIFFMMGMDMLQARLGRVKVSEEEVKAYVEDISITPLAIPMICGPGALTNAIVLMEDATTLAHRGVLLAVMTLVMLLTYLTLHSANRLVDRLGETGNKVMMRIMGLIVMVIAVEFFFAGLRPQIGSMLAAASHG
jgi:multiple antibiotic resistance protein